MPNTLVYVQSTAPSSRLSTYVKLFVTSRLRYLVSKIWDPLWRYDLNGTKLLLPLSHDLPLLRAVFPHFATCLPRIATAVHGKYDDLKITDIGANVGDTAAILRHQVHCPILCIEGDERYFRILERNAKGWKDVHLERAFVGCKDGAEPLSVLREHGTARLTVGGGTGTADLVPLEHILGKWPEFASSKLLKIDTDGFDTIIIRQSLDLLGRMKPVLFFEYDPAFTQESARDGFLVFARLRDIGYRTALFFESWGDFLVSVDLANESALSDLHEYYSGRRHHRYCDICVVHEEDHELVDPIRQAEIEFFRRCRS